MTKRAPRAISDLATLDIPEEDFFTHHEKQELDQLDYITPQSTKSGFGWGKLFFFALGALIILAIGQWIGNLIQNLATQSTMLGWIAFIITIIALIALIAFIIRELCAISRLKKVDHIRQKAEQATSSDDMALARQAIHALSQFTSGQSLAIAGRQNLERIKNDIIDGRQLIHLGEREILRPLDQKARNLILGAAKRVSIVTAVSPRALVDLGYVAFESTRLIRSLAELYGCRPGRLGYISLIKRVLTHLAVTGTLALGDGLLHQIIGQSLASKLSARLGEGVVNGLMTTRIGIAAMDTLRPFPFDGEKRPGLNEFANEIIRLSDKDTTKTSSPPNNKTNH